MLILMTVDHYTIQPCLQEIHALPRPTLLVAFYKLPYDLVGEARPPLNTSLSYFHSSEVLVNRLSVCSVELFSLNFTCYITSSYYKWAVLSPILKRIIMNTRQTFTPIFHLLKATLPDLSSWYMLLHKFKKRLLYHGLCSGYIHPKNKASIKPTNLINL